jgi:hypothetical protein
MEGTRFKDVPPTLIPPEVPMFSCAAMQSMVMLLFAIVWALIGQFTLVRQP